jgi:hypothetical protein
MILSLSHVARLNLISLFDGLECKGRREAWLVCALQERLELSDEEREAIGWRKQRTEDGREYVLWNAQQSLPVRDYEMSEDEVARICGALDKAPVVLARDKSWFRPLMEQLPEPKEEPAPPSNGLVHAGAMSAR